MKRLIGPDFVKGICIVLMVYGHVTMCGTLANDQNEIKGFIYTFHMPTFLIISGFFFRSNSPGFRGLMKVIKRLVVPYCLFESAYLVCLGLAPLFAWKHQINSRWKF